MSTDQLVPDRKVAAMFDVTPMTLYRWTNDPTYKALGFPRVHKIGSRNYRSELALRAFQERMKRGEGAKLMKAATKKAADAEFDFIGDCKPVKAGKAVR